MLGIITLILELPITILHIPFVLITLTVIFDGVTRSLIRESLLYIAFPASQECEYFKYKKELLNNVLGIEESPKPIKLKYEYLLTCSHLGPNSRVNSI